MSDTPAAPPSGSPPAEAEKRKPSSLTPQERVQRLEERLGVTFTTPALALEALTHASFCNEHRDEPGHDNERLEFLGDAVIDLTCGQRFMERFPQAREGELSKLRALVVNEEGLARTAQALGLGELLQLGRGEELTGGREKPSVLADALEAVIGALYLSNGIPAVLEFVDRAFGDAFDGAAAGRLGQDSKSRLQVELQSRLKISPRYRVANVSGPEHEKVFEVEVLVNGEVWGRSTGRSKKDAEQAAAREALETLPARLAAPSGTTPAPPAGSAG